MHSLGQNNPSRDEDDDEDDDDEDDDDNDERDDRDDDECPADDGRNKKLDENKLTQRNKNKTGQWWRRRK